MPQIDFLISNDRHHAAMMQPVVQALVAQPGYKCRVVSLCEFRGIKSPSLDSLPDGVNLIKILPWRFRSSPAVGQKIGQGNARWMRDWIRWLSWHLLLRRPVRAWLADKPNLAVLPNDAAFPYGHIVRLLQERRIPIILMQEGIRFPLPTEDEREVYGRGGAAAIAAWGEASADYFRSQGVPENKIHLTGNPRFDSILAKDWQPEAERLRADWRLGTDNLLLLSNPIDDQGFCTTQEKLELVRRFAAGIAPLFDDLGFHLIMKLHGRESTGDFASLISEMPYANRITITNSAPLYPLFKLSRAAVVMASTVGLEAMLFGLALGVLEIPRVGFVYDYVSSGAALGLTWNTPMADQVRLLLQSRLQDQPSARAYLARNLATRDGATGQIVDLIVKYVEDNSDQTRQ